MPRSARRELAGGTHWVRCVARAASPLHELEDAWREALDRAVKRCQWHVLTAAVRPEGYSLLLTTPQPNLSLGMQSLQRELAAARQRRFPGSSGPLFGQRFKSELLSGEEAIATVGAIIRRWQQQGGNLAMPRGLRRITASDKPGALAGQPPWRIRLRRGLDWYGLTESQLASLRKSAPCKKVLGAWVHGHEAVRIADLAEALHMGHPSALSRALGEVEMNHQGLGEELARLEIGLAAEENCGDHSR